MNHRHGLVVGKFYPPHSGHVHLVEAALSECDRVTVQVLHSSVESIPGPLRARWLEECFQGRPSLRILEGPDEAPIDYGSADIWDLHESEMRGLLEKADASDAWPAVDAVFSSEPYGQELARRFGAACRVVDQARDRFPVSGTSVRADTCGNWDLLPPAVRAGLARRVVVVGAESTGTTTLSRDIHWVLSRRGGIWERTRWVAEYGREYSEDLQRRQIVQNLSTLPSEFPWNEADFLAIAREQNRREEEAARTGSPVLVCDTDSLATCLWFQRYCGGWSRGVEAIADELPTRAMYLLTSPEGVVFEDDGLRDQPHLRPEMTRGFRELLATTGAPWHELVGSREERLLKAVELVDLDLANAFRFSDPKG